MDKGAQRVNVTVIHIALHAHTLGTDHVSAHIVHKQAALGLQPKAFAEELVDGGIWLNHMLVARDEDSVKSINRRDAIPIGLERRPCIREQVDAVTLVLELTDQLSCGRQRIKLVVPPQRKGVCEIMQTLGQLELCRPGNRLGGNGTRVNPSSLARVEHRLAQQRRVIGVRTQGE